MEPVSIEELKQVAALSELPDEHLQWILDRSEYHEYEGGTQIKKTGDEADVMIFILEGKVSFYLDYHGRLVYYFYYTNDVSTGGVGGLFPYSRMKVYPGCSFAVGKLRSIQLHKKYFSDLEHLNPEFIQKLIGYMTERAKLVATTQMQHEKVSALGQLSAGIAHELNNPASAINRISSELQKRLKLNYGLTEKLLEYSINSTHIQTLRHKVETKYQENVQKISALQRMEKEDEINSWLENAGVADSQQASETFVDEGFTVVDFEELGNSIEREAFVPLIQWLENLLISNRIIKDLAEASTRISSLVGSIKSHVHMDRRNDLQRTNIHTDIENTLTLLGYKLREKNITVQKNFCDNLPEVPAYVGELNQVWTNIIDNAIHALEKGGMITIKTSLKDNNAEITIIDDGAGIPADIQSRIFDPFFTTKKVGEGTGIGLDLVNRVIKHHNGNIKVSSVPGRTEFTISIPVSEAK